MRCPFHVRILEKRVAYYGEVYEVETYGFGEPTMVEAATVAARVLRKCEAKLPPFVVGYRAVFTTGCGACKVTGIVPGFKRKKCPECAGKGIKEGWT